MKARILKAESERIVALMMALYKVFPDQAKELMQVTGELKHGVMLEVVPYVPHQTDSQRGYYWMWVREFGSFCGATPDETHNHILCEAYGSDFVETRLGLKRRPQKRSANANRMEYSLLIETLIRVAAELGFVVPPAIRSAEDD